MNLAIYKNATDGIAREESLLQSGDPSQLLWMSQNNALVIPRAWSRRVGFKVCRNKAEQQGWPVVLRSSGGGAVPQGPGTLNLALIAPLKPDLNHTDCYRTICSLITHVLSQYGIMADVGSVDGSFCDGDWNVTVSGKKLVGTAQRWRRQDGCNIALVHAAILLDKPSETFWPVLRQVEERVGTSLKPQTDVHVALKDLLPTSNQIQTLYSALDQAARRSLAKMTMVDQQVA